MFRAIIFSILLLWTVKPVRAQNVEFIQRNFPGQEVEFKKALKAFNSGRRIMGKIEVDFSLARQQLELAYQFNPSNAELCYYLGICFLETSERKKAIQYLEEAKRLNGVRNDLLLYYLGLGYQRDADWDSALSCFNSYKAALSENDDRALGMVQKRIMECNNGRLLSMIPQSLTVRNLGLAINSPFEDYTPFISPDDSVLFFTARRVDSLFMPQNSKDVTMNEDIFLSRRSGDEWSVATNAGSAINSRFHDAVCGIHPNGKVLIVFKGDVNGGDLFYVTFENNRWGVLEDFGPSVNTSFHESSASFSADGKALYFVSDKPGGLGGRDIYVSRYVDSLNSWGPSQNLGAVINSSYDEEGVFMHHEGNALYFASNGILSMGGYDLLRSDFREGVWAQPVNLGAPINSPDDEVFVSVSASGGEIYFSSVREGGFGGKDIYCASLALQSLEAISDSIKINSPIEVDSLLVLQSDKQKLNPNAHGGPSESGVDRKKQDSSLPGSSGSFMNDSALNHGDSSVVFEDGYVFEVENVVPEEKFTQLDSAKTSYLKYKAKSIDALFRTIYFESGKSLLPGDGDSTMDAVAAYLLTHPAVRLFIVGHTDNSGDEMLNLQLSYKRAEIFYEGLLDRKIPADRLAFSGVGELFPSIDFEGQQDNWKNRRIELWLMDK